MRRITFCIAFVTTISINAQFSPSYTTDYYTQIGYWEEYFDSVETAHDSLGDDSEIVGEEQFSMWRRFWDKYMPPNGSFEDANNVFRELSNIQRYDQTAKISANNFVTLSSTPPDWVEIGPNSFNSIQMLDYNPITGQTEWFNPHLEGTDNHTFGGHVGRFDRLYLDAIGQKLFTYFGDVDNYGSSGLWVSENDGATWHIVGTDKIPNSTVTAFETKPAGVGTNTEDILFIGIAAGAIYRSTDNGNSWYESCYNGSNAIPLTGPIPSNSIPNAFDETNYIYGKEFKNLKFQFVSTATNPSHYARLLVARNDGLYYSDNYDAVQSNAGNILTNGISWQRFNQIDPLFNPSNVGYLHPVETDHHELWITDVEQFTRGTNNYLVAHVSRKELRIDGCIEAIVDYVIYSIDDGTNWSFLGSPTSFPNGHIRANNPVGLVTPCPQNPPFVVVSNIEVVQTNPNYVYISFAQPSDLGYTLFRYNFTTTSWEDVSSANGSHGSISPEANCLAINPLNENEYFQFFNYYTHINMGTIQDQYEDRYGGCCYGYRRHADTRDILVLNAETLYIATDGGIYKSVDHGLHFDPISEGLNGSNSGSVGVSQSPPFYVGAGYYHCGFQVYNQETGKWHYLGEGDGNDGEFSFTNNHIFSESHFSETIHIIKNYDALNDLVAFTGPAFTSQVIDWSENINGLCFVGNNHQIKKSFNNFANRTSLSFPVTFSGTPIVHTVPNKKDRLAVIDNNILYIFDNIPTSLTDPSIPTLTHSWNLNTVYQNLTGSSIGAAPGSITFDPRNPEKFYLILFQNAQWNGISPGRIVEYDPVSGQFLDITYTTDDLFYGSSTPSPVFSKFISIRDITMDRQTGILYIGTTRGVYYLDRANNIWKRYSSNLPFLSSDVQITHCNGEIFSSSASRGIWKTSLLRDNIPTIEWVIDHNETWDYRKNLFCTLVIEPGFTLTIKDSLIVYGFQKIIVKPGAKLVLDGGIITTQCGDFWAGIEVWGDRTKHQFPISGGQFYQGRLIMENHAIIENAREAVQLYNPADGYNTSGGIIQAKNSTIRNIRRAAAFLSYHNYNPTNPSQLKNNVSYFHDVTFEITNDLPENTIPAPFVTMWDVAGVKFLGCTFQTKTVPWFPSDANHSGYGIYTEDANFIVDDYCSSVLFPCPSTSLKHTLFKDLRTGIWVNKLGVNQPYTVKNAVFEDCIIGTFSQGVSNITMKNNDFSIGDWAGVPYDYHQYGSGFLGPISGYTITDNDYVKSPSAPGLGLILGVWHYNTGSNNKTFRKNNFHEMHRALQTERINKGNALFPTGLDFQCNTISNCQYDMFVAKGLFATSPNPSYGIKTDQGANSFSEGNVFSNNGDFYEILNTTGNNINYYYYNVPPLENPTTISTNVVKFGVGTPNGSCTTASGGGPRILNDMIADYSTRNQDYQNYKLVLQALIDGGNTPGLRNNVNNASLSETEILRQQLLGNSPYLSVDVLKAASNRSDVLPEAVLFEILLANPTALKKPGLMKHIKDRTVPLPEWMILLLEQAQGTIDLRSLVEATLSNYSAKRNESITEIITYYESEDSLRNDSVLRGWYSLYDNYQADYAIVESFIKEGKFTAAHDFLSTIEASHDLSESELQDLSNYTEFIQLYIQILQSGHTMNNLSGSSVNYIQSLTNLANSSNDLTGSIRARGILNFFYGTNYQYEPVKPEQESPKVMLVTIPEEFQNHIDVYPVPATDWVAFSYRMQSGHGKPTLQIFNSLGSPVLQVQLNNTSGVYVADVSSYAAGIYAYRIMYQGSEAFAGKLIIE